MTSLNSFYPGEKAMSVKTLNRRLLQIEAKHYARVVRARELKDKGKEITDLLRRYEEVTRNLSANEKFEMERELAHEIAVSQTEEEVTT